MTSWRRAWKGPGARPGAPSPSAVRRGALSALGSGILVEHVVRRRDLAKLPLGDLPRLLHDPREGAVEPLRLGLNLVQHVLGEVEALLARVGGRHLFARLGPPPAPDPVTHRCDA